MKEKRGLVDFIAEEIMGWQPIPQMRPPAWRMPDGTIRTQGPTSFESFCPHTDFPAAFEVVTQVRLEYPWFSLEFDTDDGEWLAAFGRFKGHGMGRHAKTIQVAICLAARAAWAQ